MHTMFRRTKRFILILAGTAALGAGAVVPAAMAEPPSGSGGDVNQIAEHYEVCGSLQASFNGDIDNATNAALDGDFIMANADVGAAQEAKTDADDAGCNTSGSDWGVPAVSTGTVSSHAPVAPVEAAQQ
jgi:hypothetical protein